MTLFSLGNVIIDIIAEVPALPERGADMLAHNSSIAAGGSFNTMAAASRQGVDTVYAGAHGAGVFGDRVRQALAAEGISALHAPVQNADTGYDIALIDHGGERTFVTVFGAEARLTREHLERVELAAADFVHVSGYGLLDASNGGVLGEWVAEISAAVVVLVDPGPLVRDIRPSVWNQVIGRADWLSCNEREALILTGESDAAAAARTLASHTSGVVVRTGPGGCLLGLAGDVRSIEGFTVAAIDTNGAGDAHVGAFIAALSRGEHPERAVVLANAAAAFAVSRRGPATAPTTAELQDFLAGARR